jgi:hypothetical protein
MIHKMYVYQQVFTISTFGFHYSFKHTKQHNALHHS